MYTYVEYFNSSIISIDTDSVWNLDENTRRHRSRPVGRTSHKPRGGSVPSVSRAELIKKKARIVSKVLSQTCRTLRRDGVDEKCAREGIKYYRWKGKRGKGRHLSHKPVSKVLIDYIPRGQKIKEDCILCPKEICPSSELELLDHIWRVHVRRLITLRDMNLLMCHCSDVCSQGCDNSIRNRHWHCVQCWQPCTTPDKLRTHLLYRHNDIYQENELNHLKKSRGDPEPKS